MPLEAVIHEKFGDGIMSAIMSSKFLPDRKWQAPRL